MKVFYCKDRNFGDDFNEYLVKKMGHSFEYTETLTEPYYLLVGSLFHERYVTSNAIVCGIGIGSQTDIFSCPKEIRLVRGPYTQARCSSLGYECPKSYGDPMMIVPLLYSPAIQPSVDVVFLPHKIDTVIVQTYLQTHPPPFSYLVVDLCVDSTGVEKVIDQMLTGKIVASSSLHGIIVGHAYKKPTIWIKTFNTLCGDGVKFLDHFSAMELYDVSPREISDANLLDPFPQPSSSHVDKVSKHVLQQLEDSLKNGSV